MSAPHIILASLPSFCQNYQNWWKFEEVLAKTILHLVSFETQFIYASVWMLCVRFDCMVSTFTCFNFVFLFMM